ncbi:MAG: DivIVA domain-containing protein [Solobacterium sp.]|jgi:DivIVA domain-containing protein|nr:DivIVA domain-containing protein [Solobacterium sp.]MBR3344450.1 DivIVA domain-containing protein [Solobacterium sp.]
MAVKANLDIQAILDKEFNVDFKGYNATEVDAFLDLVIQDYQMFQQTCADLMEKNGELERTNATLRAKLIELEGRTKVQAENSPSMQGQANIDILKRISRLEEQVFEQKK